ncbi:trypsin-like cysteine/serine peptidase domain-containing protein [Annulohypoxylon truncatum]|uniref:trypsin-like cysteine/serine peptidase domain-containing protein n=1 Tax=Annulohypoxylon truncatum TaxID=327061 RepID=UPI0020075B00|nr:trypsin-like cysteine/serine peptidase domain-containing protein [Annulohypoxylon truncatum]KAI1204076.1 trypsin-like cysteine/serine peptidase domain-containing protein [Annulohypoxylon truncatum]
MELFRFLAFLAAVLPVAYGAPTQASNSLHPKLLAAMKRDLGLDADQATARVARDLWASDVIEQLKTSAGDSFAGAWIAEDGTTLNVAVTDQALAAEVSAAGATPAVVANSFSKLEQAKLALDNMDIEQPKTLSTDAAETGIAAYYVDVTANKLVIEALAGSTAHAEDLAAQVGLVASEFEVRTVDAMPTTFATVLGGDAYIIDRVARCSVGFSVTTGFVSAGHCGTAGSSATTSSGASLGTFSGSVFPGSADMSYIRTVSGTTLSGYIDGYGSGNLPVSGSTASATGASICRSGSTSGVHCGTVRALGATVTYAEGRVTGLTQTSVCAEPGDSGGSFYTGAQAQGVTSGGSGDCTIGGVTYFQPVNEILSTYGLTLVRA